MIYLSITPNLQVLNLSLMTNKDICKLQLVSITRSTTNGMLGLISLNLLQIIYYFQLNKIFLRRGYAVREEHSLLIFKNFHIFSLNKLPIVEEKKDYSSRISYGIFYSLFCQQKKIWSLLLVKLEMLDHKTYL